MRGSHVIFSEIAKSLDNEARNPISSRHVLGSGASQLNSLFAYLYRFFGAICQKYDLRWYLL